MSNLPLIAWVNGPCMIVSQNQYEPPAGFGTEISGEGAPPINLLFQNLIPFLYENGTLDIDFAAQIPCFPTGFCTFQDTMMTTITDVSVPHFPTYFNFPISSQVRMMGGTNLVTDIGPNFRQYISTLYSSQYEGNVTSIRVYSPGIVTKVQILDITTLGTWLSIINPAFAGGSSYASGDSIEPPVGNYVSQFGGEGYGITYVFKQPITIAVIVEGEPMHYFTLKSQISTGTM